MSRPAIGIVGASLAGLHAAGELRRRGFDDRVVVIGEEPHPPYDRPPLSKEILRRERTRDEIALSREEASDVEWRLGAQATALDAEARRVTLEDGSEETFDAGIVIATGARPRRLSSDVSAGVHVLRTLDDATALAAELAHEPRHVLVIGAGFIGLEVAASARTLGCAVTVLEALPDPLDRVVGAAVGHRVAEIHRAQGVTMRFGVSVVALQADADGHVAGARLSDGSQIAADLVVAGIGVEPNVEWLEGSGLMIERGVLVDETCLAAPGIVAAGDVACWPSRRREELRVVEHWDNAMRQGAHAAARLLAGDDGADMVYDPVPWFWSDQYTHKLQLLGSADGHDELLVVDDRAPEGRLLVLYRRGDRLAAVFGIGRGRQMVRCRALLGDEASWDEAVQTMREAVPA